MKIGIVTFTDGTNIGQRLQNYALQSVLERESNSEVYTIVQKRPFGRIKQLLKMMGGYVINFQAEIDKQKRNSLFSCFNKSYIKMYKRKMWYNAKEFDNSFDLFFAGSDQIWNPYSMVVNSNFFLEFCQTCKRRTYAPSFSVEKIPFEKRKQYAMYMSGFNSLSVREVSGAKIINELSGKKAIVVLDPTLLLDKDDYDFLRKTYKEKPSSPYILSMFLGDYANEVVDFVNKEGAFSVVKVDKETVLGPSEFLDLINDAYMIITDSYHVTIFSIIYRKKFIVYDRNDDGPDMSTRFDTLLESFYLSYRKWDNIQNEEKMIDVLDYDAVETKLNDLRIQSLNFLRCEIDK